MFIANPARPWLLGSLAVYAPNLHAARQAYDLLSAGKRTQAFGTVTLESGEDVDWIDMTFEPRQLSCLK